MMALAAADIDFSTSAMVKEIQLELGELRRKRDLAQNSLTDPGMNVPKLKADIAAYGLEIDRLQQEFDQAVSANVTRLP